MKLNDLKTGMVIETREGWRALVLIGCDFDFGNSLLNNCLIGEEINDYMPLSNYNEDMTCNSFGDDTAEVFDIMFVYQPHHPYNVMSVLGNVDTNEDIADCIYNRKWEERNE